MPSDNWDFCVKFVWVLVGNFFAAFFCWQIQKRKRCIIEDVDGGSIKKCWRYKNVVIKVSIDKRKD